MPPPQTLEGAHGTGRGGPLIAADRSHVQNPHLVNEPANRISCPSCGTRFRVEPAQFVGDPSGRHARCRSCKGSYLVRFDGGRWRVEAVGGAVPPTPPPPPAHSVPADPGPPGERLGRYELEVPLGRGGMGVVARAFDPVTNRQVALKILPRDASDLDARRFEREIAIQGRLAHPNILPIHDSGTAGRTRFYAMALLHDPIGLDRLVEELHDGRLRERPGAEAIRTFEGLLRHVFLPIAAAVQHANVREGVLHRDIKPANVLVDPDGWRPYLVDFGVASLLRRDNPRFADIDDQFPMPLRGEGVFVTGTLLTMPPEQARGEAHPRGDVWSLGALIHTLISGRPPYEPAVQSRVPVEDRKRNVELLLEDAIAAGRADEVRTYRALLDDLRSGRERTPETLRREVLRGQHRPLPPGTSRSLAAIVERAMAVDPDARHEDAAFLGREIEAWLDRKPVGGGVPGALSRSRRGTTALAASAALVLGAAGAYVLTRPADDDGAASARVAEEARAEAERVALRRAFDIGLEDVARSVEVAEREPTAAAREERLRAAASRLEDVLARGRARVEAHPDDDARVAALRAALDPRFEVVLEGVAPDLSIDAIPWDADDGRIGWDAARRIVPDGGVVRLAHGSWIVRFLRDGRSVLVPFEVPDRPRERPILRCPIAPNALRAGEVLVGAGTIARGPWAGVEVPALLWDLHEVTQATYGAWLRSLPREEAWRRVPRRAGDLGQSGAPLWEAGPDGLPAVPPGAASRPVDGISVRDAIAHAKASGARLPTAAEWAWAALAGGPGATPIGPLHALGGADIHVDRSFAGPRDVLGTPLDRSPWGVFDLAGNLAEMTATFDRYRGESGWWILGGGYRLAASSAVVAEPRVAPGWQPLAGVGHRRVRPFGTVR